MSVSQNLSALSTTKKVIAFAAAVVGIQSHQPQIGGFQTRVRAIAQVLNPDRARLRAGQFP